MTAPAANKRPAVAARKWMQEGRSRLPRALACAALFISLASPTPRTAAQESRPARSGGLSARDLAVVINSADPLSVRIGEYYAKRRGVPEANVIRVALPTGKASLTRGQFTAVKAEVDARTPRSVQAFALAWLTPYRVAQCMSITSAFALGYDRE